MAGERIAPPRIAHVFGAMDRGGAELRTLDVVARLPEMEHFFLCLSGRRGDLTARIEAMGGHVVPLKLLSPAFPLRFVRFLRRERITSLHSNVATFSGLLLLLGRLARVHQRIAHFRSDSDGQRDTVRRRLQRAGMRRLIDLVATDIWAVSPGAMTGGLGRADWSHDARCRVVPNGLDVVRLRAMVDAGVPVSVAPIVAHVARSLPSKNRARAVRIAAVLAAETPGSRLLLVGPVDEREGAMLDQQIAALPAGAEVVRTGPVDDVPGLLRHCSALLVTSTREGLPGVVLEALAVGTPVVATPLPGTVFISELVRGITLVPLDAPDQDWKRALLHAARADAAERTSIAASFAGSPFRLDAAVAAYRSLWERGRRSEAEPAGKRA